MLITLKKEDNAVITIRPATVEDIVAIEAIAKEAYEPYVPRIGQCRLLTLPCQQLETLPHVS